MEDTPTPIAEIDHGPSKFEAFLEKYQKLLIIVAIVAFLAVLGYVFYTSYQKQQNENAGYALNAAMSTPDTGDAIKALDNVISEYGSSPSAATAFHSISNLLGKDDPAKSAEKLTNFIATYKDNQLVPIAEFKLAQIQINLNKLSEAKATLESLKSREDGAYLTPRVQISLGDIARLEGDKEKAIQHYSEAEKSDSIFANTAKARISFINAKKPELIKPVAPKPVQPLTPLQPATPETTEPAPTTPAPAPSEGPTTPPAVIPATPIQPATPAPAEPTEPAKEENANE